jgi:XapX domain-containing protein
MKEILLSLSVGLTLGLIILSISASPVKIPIPAPPVFAGVAGIIGLWLAQPVWVAIAKFIS